MNIGPEGLCSNGSPTTYHPCALGKLASPSAPTFAREINEEVQVVAYIGIMVIVNSRGSYVGGGSHSTLYKSYMVNSVYLLLLLLHIISRHCQNSLP